MKFSKILGFFLIIFVFTACAVKRFPKVPFLSRIPKVKQLNYEIKKANLAISWKRVKKENKINSYNLYQAKAPEGIKYNFKSDKNYDLIKKINVAELPQDIDIVTLKISKLKNNYKYCYAIRVENKKGKEGGFSNKVCVDWLILNDIISNVKVHPDDKSLKITWKINKYKNISYIGINIYQKLKNEIINIASEVTGNSYTIDNLENKKVYEFYIAPVYTYYKTKIEGKYLYIAGVPEDLTPPELPEFITGVYTNNGIMIKWTRSISKDILGYDIERKAEGENKFVRLNKNIIKDEKFFDSNVKKGKVYYYRIRCIDKNFNVSKFSKPIKVIAE